MTAAPNRPASTLSADRAAWAEGIQRISEEAAGVLVLQVVQHEDLPALLTEALLGDREAMHLATFVAQARQRIENAPRNRPMLCGCCPRSVRGDRYSLIYASPHRDGAREAVAMAICLRCGTDHGSVGSAASRALSRIWPDLRPISINATEGRA